jgi:hypothetical protein
MPTAPTVFISYSHKDEVWKDRLVKQLAVLQKQGLLETWDDRRIGAGQEWLEEIQKGMAAARVAVFLVSADSLTSDFILHTEIPRLLERREQEMTVFPVICTHCLWEEIPWLARLQARPLDGSPLAGFQGNRRDAELTKIAKEILSIVRNGAPQVRSVNQPDTAKLTTLVLSHQLTASPTDLTGRQEPREGANVGRPGFQSRPIRRLTYPRPPCRTGPAPTPGRTAIAGSSPPIRPSMEGRSVSTKRSVSTICSTRWLM